MGRTGGGSSSHGRSSGGSHSFSRSSGGHRVGGSGSMRTGSGSSRSYSSGPSYRRSYGTSYHYGPSYYRRPRVYVSGGYTYYRNPVRSAFDMVIGILMVLIIAICLFGAVSVMSKPSNSIVRNKLETGNAFDNNCIDDQIGWFDNVRSAEAQLQKFWKETGVQPYIIMKADDGTLTTDAEKDAWLNNFYDTEIAPREDAFVYCYFYQNGEESSGIPSYMGYTSGYEASSVMDAAAVDIFWGYIDRYWVTDMSTDDVFTSAFNKTGEVIMHVSTTGKDIVKWVVILVVTVVVGGVLIALSKVWFKDRREKAKEDERILNTSVEHLASTQSDLESKYLN